MTFQANDYAIYDFQETLHILDIDPRDVRAVVGAWGHNGSYAEWEGGFLLHLFDGRYAVASGYCDTSGWGCRDGADIAYFDHEPSVQELKDDPDVYWPGGHVDPYPSDLNKWIQDGARQKDVWV